ncbi:MAG: hypothetical protein ABIS29_08435 [Vicinamibacterales bacterium]
MGLVIGVAQALGLSDYDKRDYGRAPDPAMMGRELAAHLDPIAFRDVLPGDVLWLRVTVEPQHLAIVSQLDPLSIVHSYSRPGVMRVIEQAVSTFWRSRIMSCHRFRGVE